MIRYSYKLSRQPYEWPIYTGNNSNTYSTLETIPKDLVQRNNIIINTTTDLVVSNGTIYVNDKTQANKLYAIDIATNTVKWQYVAQGASGIGFKIAVGNMIFFIAGSGITALQDTGSSPVLKWSIQGYIYSFNYDGDKLYYTTTDNSIPAVVVLDSATGNEIKRFSVGNPQNVAGVITVGGGRLYFGVNESQTIGFGAKLYSIDETTGQVLWIADLFDSRISTTGMPAYMAEKVYLDSQPTVNNVIQYLITAYDAATGKTLWKYDLKNPWAKIANINRFVVNKDSVVTLDQAGYLVAINKDTGVERWRVKYSYFYTNEVGQSVEAIRAGRIIATGDMIILNNFKNTELFDAASGALLSSISAPNLTFSPQAVAQKTLILSNENGLLTYVPAGQGVVQGPLVQFKSLSPLRISAFEPFNQSTVLSILLSEDADAVLTVKNSNNQIIRTQNLGRLKSGLNSIYWDARDDQGKPVPYGQYHFALNLKDPAGVSATYEFTDNPVTVGDLTAVTLTDLNLRSGPGTQYSILGVVPTSTSLKILDETDGWFKVNYYPGNLTGYVSKQYVSTYSHPVLVTVQSLNNYIVQPGDTLYKIALKNNTTVAAILSVNKLVNPNILNVGMPLAIPVMVQQPVTLIHVVAPGDTLWKISNYYNVPLSLILKNNPSINPNNLYVGQKILIK